MQELQQLYQEQDMMRRATEVERDKMTELVQVLQSRYIAQTAKIFPSHDKHLFINELS